MLLIELFSLKVDSWKFLNQEVWKHWTEHAELNKLCNVNLVAVALSCAVSLTETFK